MLHCFRMGLLGLIPVFTLVVCLWLLPDSAGLESCTLWLRETWRSQTLQQHSQDMYECLINKHAVVRDLINGQINFSTAVRRFREAQTAAAEAQMSLTGRKTSCDDQVIADQLLVWIHNLLRDDLESNPQLLRRLERERREFLRSGERNW